MPIKIKETVERECCQSKDLRPYQGRKSKALTHLKSHFCVHCGQIWINGKDEYSEPILEPLEANLHVNK